MLLTSEFPPGPGGIGHHAYQVARHLCRRGWQVVVLTPQSYATAKEIASFNQEQDFSIVRLKEIPGPPIEAFYRVAVLHRWRQRQQPDVLLASGQRAVWLAAFFTRFAKIPWVAVGHGFEFGVKDPLSRRLNRLTYSQAHCLISVSAYTQSRMLGMGIRPKQQVVIHNGADDELFQVLPAESVQRWCRAKGLEAARLLLTVGNVTERKGQEVVIRALPKIRQSVPDVHYLIAGLPTLKDKLIKIAATLGVADRVHFLGKVSAEQLVMAYNACDVFVMTSRHASTGDFEGFGIAAVEAALCGKPAVVTQNSGLEEAIQAGRTGLTVPENNPDATAAAIIHLLQNESLRLEFGHNARQRALQEQTWSRCVDRYVEVLKMVSQQIQ